MAPLKFTVRFRLRPPTKFVSAFICDDEVLKSLRKILISQKNKPDQFVASLVDHYESGSQWTSTQRAWAHFFATKLAYQASRVRGKEQASLVFTLLRKPNPAMPDIDNDSTFKSPFKSDEEARAVLEGLSEEDVSNAGNLVGALHNLVKNSRPWPPYLRGWGHYIAHQIQSGRVLPRKVLDDHWDHDTSDDSDLCEGDGLKKPPRGVKVTIDTREGLLLDALGHNDATDEKRKGYEVARLDVGDVVIEDDTDKLIIERKTVRDLLSSHRDGRLRNQLSALLEAVGYQRHRVIVLVEGSVDSRFNTELVYGYMVRIPIRDRLVLLRTESLHETITVLDKIVQSFKKLCAGPSDFTPVRVASQVYKAQKTPDHDMINMLMAVKGVSTRMAYASAKRYPTMKRLVAALEKPGGLEGLARAMQCKTTSIVCQRLASSIMGKDWEAIPAVDEEYIEQLRSVGIRGVQLDFITKQSKSLQTLQELLEGEMDKMELLAQQWGLDERTAMAVIKLACGEDSAEYQTYSLVGDLAEKVNGLTREVASEVVGGYRTKEQLKMSLPASPSDLDAWYEHLGLRRRAFRRLLRYLVEDEPEHPILSRINLEEALLDKGIDAKQAIALSALYPSISDLQAALRHNSTWPTEVKLSASNQTKLLSLCASS